MDHVTQCKQGCLSCTTRRAGWFSGLGGRSVTLHPEHRSTCGMTGEDTEAGAGWGLGQDPGEKQKKRRTGAQKRLAVGCKFYFYLKKKTFIWLQPVLAVAHRIFSLRWHTGSSSLTRDPTRVPCIGTAVLAIGPPGKSLQFLEGRSGSLRREAT